MTRHLIKQFCIRNLTLALLCTLGLMLIDATNAGGAADAAATTDSSGPGATPGQNLPPGNPLNHEEHKE